MWTVGVDTVLIDCLCNVCCDSDAKRDDDVLEDEDPCVLRPTASAALPHF